MKYLLSTGRSTTDPIRYIKDVILLNMKLLPREIPYFNGGSNELIKDVAEYNLESNAKLIITDIINRISSQFKSITVELDSIEVHNRTITAKIKIGDIIEIYDIA